MGQICKRCVMDESDPNIVFDEQGFCNHCNTFYETARRALKPHEDLPKLMAKIKHDGKGLKYDGAIGISGGIDSSYVAYISHQFDLNLLAIHFDNGYDSPEGTHNIKMLIENTGWDLENRTMDFDEFRDLQLAYLRSGVKNLEAISDHAIKATVYKVATEYNLKYLIKGNNWITEGILPKAWGYRHIDLVNIKNIHRKHGRIPLKTYPQMGVINWARLTVFRGITEIKPLNYIDYNVKKAKNTLAREWGWKDYGWKHFENIITRFYQAFILPIRWGYDKRKPHLSTLICSGQSTRDEAIKILENPPYSPEILEVDYYYILEKLGLSEKEFTKLMELPKGRHEDYGTDQGVYSLLRTGLKIARFVGVKY